MYNTARTSIRKQASKQEHAQGWLWRSLYVIKRAVIDLEHWLYESVWEVTLSKPIWDIEMPWHNPTTSKNRYIGLIHRILQVRHS